MRFYKISKDIDLQIKRLTELGRKKLTALIDQKLIVKYCPPLPSILFCDIPEEIVNGFYQVSQNIIVLSEKLIGTGEYLDNVFLHELAHFVDHVINGASCHDGTFKDICLTLGVDPAFSGATVKEEVLQIKKREDKVRKLLNLGQSSFKEEAESAILKARELMEKWSINLEDDKDELYVFEVPIKRKELYLGALAMVVSMVTGTYTLYTNDCGELSYRFYGNKDQVESAMYIHDSLLQAVEIKCEDIVKKLKTPEDVSDIPFVSENIQPTLFEYSQFLEDQEKKARLKKATETPKRIDRRQIKAGILCGLEDKLRENSSKEIAVRQDANKSKLLRIRELHLKSTISHVRHSEGFRDGYKEGKQMNVPSSDSIVKQLKAN